MASLAFLDTNILLRHLTGDHPDHSPRATALLARVETGDLQLRTVDTVVFETVFTLEKLYRQPRTGIRDLVLPLIELPGIVLRGKGRMRRTFALYIAHPALSFADCYHVASMESLRLRDIVSFDRGLDRVPSITRREPDGGGELA
jgi:predicted nucleic acid-binding protein